MQSGENLLEEFVPGVYRFALRLTHDPHVAEDLTQETFLRAWRRQGLLRHPEALRVWLFRIVANLWRDQLRRGKLPVARAGPLPADFVGGMPAPERSVEDQEDVRRAMEALQGLPERQREVLYLSACEGLSAAEIAVILGISNDAVKANLCLARKRLRQELRDLYEDRFPVT
jgi:RNA polymerase sigma-70 factor (ECF subfamily)